MFHSFRAPRRFAHIALVLAACASAQQPKFKAIWEPVNVKEDLHLASAHFVTPEEGWAAGGASTLAGGVILHTKDSGASWEVQLGDPQSSDRAYHDFRFSGPLGWAVQSTGTGDHKLLRLDGSEWKAVGTVAQHRGDYRFTSAQTGFVTTGDTIQKTQDGGRSWRPVYRCQMKVEVNGLTRDFKCQFAKLFFLNERTGWAISAAADKAGFLIAKTSDGGGTWESSVVLPGEDPREGSIWFTDEIHAALLTGGKFFYSADGGKTWTGASGEAPGKPEIEFAGTQVGWAIHYNKMSYTVDGGKHWVSRQINFPSAVLGFTLTRPDSGYVAGDHGMVYRYRVVPIEYTAKGMLAAPMMAAK
ncbi:MAG TPA: YCF48-related protein [Bryobacteraceae bacterium]|nr:YCF48-related protein [Bryobacteraceae bacterium]